MTKHFFQLMGLVFVFAMTMACNSEPKQAEATDETEQQSETSEETTATTSAAKPEGAIFDIPAAKITYRFGGVESGTVTFYFDNYGKRWVRDANLFVASNFNQKELRFWDGKRQVSYERNPKLNKYKQAIALDKNTTKASFFADFAGMSPEVITQRGTFKKLDDVKIAGKPCQLYYADQAGQKYFIWNGINLKMENNSKTYEANEVEIIDAIPAELLEVPEDYQLTES